MSIQNPLQGRKDLKNLNFYFYLPNIQIFKKIFINGVIIKFLGVNLIYKIKLENK
jgi:hypothetical protein